jgi:hypothetical protein
MQLDNGHDPLARNACHPLGDEHQDHPLEGPFSMLMNVLSIVACTASGFTVPMFGYLKYRTYMSTVRHIVDTLGVDGLERLTAVAPPSSMVQRLTRDDQNHN